MRRIISLLPAIIFSTLYLSCSKETTGKKDFYIKAKIDGEEKTFTNNAKAGYNYGDFTNTFYMSAYDDADLLPCAGCLRLPAISLSLYFRTAPVAKATYTQFQPTTENIYGINGVYYSYLTYNPQAQPPFIITIDSINDKVVSGTFSGEYFDSTLLHPSVVITDGKFHLPVE